MPDTEGRQIRLALAQIAVEGGALEANLARVEVAVAEAASAGADIVVLPEAADVGWAHPAVLELADVIPGGAAVTA